MEKVDYVKQGKRNKQKGQEYERLICKIINDYLGTGFGRTPGSGGMHWKGDIRNEGNKSIMDIIHFEIKNVLKLHLLEWLRQAYTDAPCGKLPTVISKIPKLFNTIENKNNRIQHIITMDLFDFLNLMKIIDEKGVVVYDNQETKIIPVPEETELLKEKRAELSRKAAARYSEENKILKEKYDERTRQYKERAKKIQRDRRKAYRENLKRKGTIK